MSVFKFLLKIVLTGLGITLFLGILAEEWWAALVMGLLFFLVIVALIMWIAHTIVEVLFS